MSDFPEVKDHLVENPDKYTMTTNPDGTVTLRPTWVDNPAEVLQEGTPVNAAFLAKIPEAIDAIDTKVTTQLADIATNVKRFGAKGDGMTDDTVAIQAAIDYINTTQPNFPFSGGDLMFPSGTFLVTNLSIKTTISLKGLGYSSTLKVSGSIETPKELSKKLLIENIRIVGVGNSTTLNIEKTWSGSSSVTFQLTNVWFHNESGQGLLLDVYGARESGITDCWFTSGLTSGSQTDGIRFRADANGGAMNIQVNGCQFHHLRKAIVGAGDPNNHQFLAGLRLINNMMISVSEGYRVEHADYVLIEQSMLDFVDKPVYANRVANLKVRNNYFAVRGDFNSAVVVENTITGYQMHWLDIANNRIFSYATNKGDAIVVNANGGEITYGNISNNYIDLVRKSIVLGGSGGGRAMNLKVDQNRSRNVDTFIELNAGAENNDVEGNYAETTATNFIVNNNPSGGNRLNKGNRYGTKRSQTKGKIVASGDGTKTQFSANHNLLATANHGIATLGSSAIRSIPFHVTYDASQIHINFATAPAAGTNNVIVNWEAEL